MPATSGLDALIPDLATAATVVPLTLVYAVAAAAFVGWLRMARGVRTAYTRKIFHFLVLSVALVVQLRWGAGGVVVFGSVIAVLVLAAVVRGDGFAFYEALARPSDAPHRTMFIVVPLITTAVGGALANLLFPLWAPLGYMVVAWGDAIGEPVGARWGRHRYTVPSLAGVPATRSLEGSAAVLVASAAAAAVALFATGVEPGAVLWAAPVIGVAAALVEAISNHGLDNLTLQLAAAGTAWLLLG